MIRATLAVCVLLASILVLGQNLVDTNDTSAEPGLISVPVDGHSLQKAKEDSSTAFAWQRVQLVDHQEPVDEPGVSEPSLDTLAQRWGGRSNFRSRIRKTFNKPAVVTPTKPWQTQTPPDAAPAPSTSPTPAKPGEVNPADLPMAKIGKPIAPPPSRVPSMENKARPLRRSRRAATPAPTPAAEPTAPQRQRKNPPRVEELGSSGILDPADPRTRLLRPLTPSPTPEPIAASQPEAKTLPAPSSTSTQKQVTVTKPRYFDADWYQPVKMTSTMRSRKKRIDQVLNHYYKRPLNSKDHSPWSLMHTMVAWGSDSYIRAGGPTGRTVGTVHWLANNGISDGIRLMFVKDGILQARTGPGVQGHDGQFLAMLAQTRVRASYPLTVDGYDFTVSDLVELEKKTVRSDMELTFKLIALAHYLAPDDVWRSSTGTRWSIPKLINAEIAAPINGVTCGGTHRLMGLKYAVRMRRRAGMPVDGEFARAEKYTSDYVTLALNYQNDDGSFSSNFWRGRGNWGDNDRKLKTSGHILEYVVFSLPHEKLFSQQVTDGVDYLTSLLIENRMVDWPKGPIGHAIRALSLYNERVYNTPPGGRRAALMAQKRAERDADNGTVAR